MLFLTHHHSPTNGAFTVSDNITPSSAVAGSALYSALQVDDQDTTEKNGLWSEAVFLGMAATLADHSASLSAGTEHTSVFPEETELSGIACQRPRNRDALALREESLFL